MLARGYTVTEQAQHTEGAALRLYTNEVPTVNSTSTLKLHGIETSVRKLKYGRER